MVRPPRPWGLTASADRGGFDVGFDCAGAPGALDIVPQSLRREATTVCIGVPRETLWARHHPIPHQARHHQLLLLVENSSSAHQLHSCSFSNFASTRGVLSCAQATCRTRCPAPAVSRSCPISHHTHRLGLTLEGGHPTGGAAGPAGRLSACRASVRSTPRCFGS